MEKSKIISKLATFRKDIDDRRESVRDKIVSDIRNFDEYPYEHGVLDTLAPIIAFLDSILLECYQDDYLENEDECRAKSKE